MCIANEIPACPQCHDKLTNHGYRIERRRGVTYTYGPTANSSTNATTGGKNDRPRRQRTNESIFVGGPRRVARAATDAGLINLVNS